MTVLDMEQSSLRLEQLAALHRVMLANHDRKNAAKLVDLYEKTQKKELVIGFTGHFSAGKSSMINTLMGKQLLPKGPIPTSANIVKLTSGDGVARIYFHNEPPVEYDEPYDIEVIKEFCKDKDTINKIELSTTENIFPENCAIIDTPGIDAADETDRLITESSLHLIDRMFYMVDYNHVQSEENLTFLKKIQTMRIPFFLIINQIDKHHEEELTFSSFQEKVKQTFDQWDIKPKHVFYTSLIDRSVPYNQLDKLQHQLFNFFHADKREDLLNIKQATLTIVNEHKLFLKQMTDEKIAHQKLSTDVGKHEEKRLNELTQQIELLKNKPFDIVGEFRKAINQTLNNAYLMPAHLRDKANLFLEAHQKDFKVGLFNSTKKKKSIQEERTHSFLSELQKSIEANLQWKLRDKLQQLLKTYALENNHLKQDIQQIQIFYTANDLLKLTKEGAQLNGNYVLNYTNDVSADIVRKFKQKINILIESVQQTIEKTCQQRIVEYNKEREGLQRAFSQKEKADDIQASLKKKLQVLDNQLQQPHVSKQDIEQLDEYIKTKRQSVQKAELSDHHLNGNETVTEPNTDIKTNNRQGNSVEESIAAVNQTIQTVESLPGFESILDALQDKMHKLHERQFTFVLFGAFSSGKSSFANALIGEKLLPTSPNPTTAVINKIAPPTKTWAHESVLIRMKDEATLMNDIKTIVKPIFHHDIDQLTNLVSIVQWMDENNIPLNEDINKEYQTFLQAVITGYQQHAPQIGQHVTIHIDDFAKYVTDESKACYIEEVTLYYDCAFTRHGITLVDTPGADSINARHTNVSFDYIKHADAIAYITYYNHALSRADQDFLKQLGRVKETFELDKMFFIINAADLAENEQELTMVKEYVKDQLITLGIRFPQIYPLSSKIALAEQKSDQENKPMITFKENFFNYIHDDLAQVIIQSACHDIKRAKQTLADYIETINLNDVEREQFRVQLLKSKENVEETIQTYTFAMYEQRLKQKIEKQLYYVNERLSIRFHDMFKDMFNPATINETGKKAIKQIERQMQQLLDYSGYELLQEIRAVSLRIEAYIRELIQESDQDLRRVITNENTTFVFSDLEPITLKTPTFQQAFLDLHATDFDNDLALFKSTKAFFEKNEKDLIKEAIYNTLGPYIEVYIDESQETLIASYLSQWKTCLNKRKQQLLNDVASYVDNRLNATRDTINIDDLENKYHIIENILINFSKKEVKNEKRDIIS